MHPALRQLRPSSGSTGLSAPAMSAPTAPEGLVEESVGLSRVQADPQTHPRVQMKKDAAEAYVPPRNVFRDDPGLEGESLRDLQFKAGKHMRLDRERVLTDRDFETSAEDSTGISPARAHLEAANMLTAYEQTVRQEKNFQATFNNNVRTLLTRQEVTLGLMHLWDFISAYLERCSPHKSLTSQLMLIAQHCREDGILRDSLLNICEPESRWLVDLIDVLQSIIVQERQLKISEKVAAINYAVIQLSKFYAQKIFHSQFVPLDKELKIVTFYMRSVVKVLLLSEDLGVYRNHVIQRYVSSSRRRELSDRDLMWELRRAFAETGQEATEASRPPAFWKERYGPMDDTSEEDEEEEGALGEEGLADVTARYRLSEDSARRVHGQPGDAGLFAGQTLRESGVGRDF
ncbi:L1 52/55 kDa encapsidation protein [Mastadenovirus porcusquartum]|uniref:L1 52/55 kDa encapsidation protein n=1 Tax=Mastadenovirus porcusquartum TaxID=3241439 RepID=A0A7H0S536_9ADEN|nr:L1 52/55 kDa encapsidation protein [Porcine mastadenovirus B]QNQ79245.1 L1 52/55 kDa encapsidation protein [Porcine mastadenovirus B]